MDVFCVDCECVIPEAPRQRRRCDACRIDRVKSYSLPIRTLQPGEEPPSGEPRKYLSGHGYVRLRWKTPEGYVETYEHRVVVNAQAGTHVHHRDHMKANNDPGNLHSLTPQEHRAEHVETDSRRINVEYATTLYQQGWGTTRIGQVMGKDPSAVFRALRKHGVEIRQGFGGPQRKVNPT